MTLDIAMGGSTNTVLHLLAAAEEAGCRSPWRISTGCRGARLACAKWRPPKPMCIWKTCTAQAASWRSWASWIAPGSSTAIAPPCMRRRIVRGAGSLGHWPRHRQGGLQTSTSLRRAACATTEAFSQNKRSDSARPRPRRGRDPRRRTRLLEGWRARGALREHRRGRLHREDRRASTQSILKFSGPARDLRKSGRGGRANPRREGESRAMSW